MAREPKRRRRIEEAREFFTSYTAGADAGSFRRLFDRDAAEAYSVLTRDQAAGAEPKTGLRRFLHRIRVLFLGLSYQLTPPRRLLFAGSLVAAFLALSDSGLNVGGSESRVTVRVDLSDGWFVIALAGLVFLLALELVDRIRVRDELEVARELQRQLLPEASPEVPGYAFAHSYRTANEVGGDYYDVQRLPDGRVVLVVADASGHGMAAGLLMAIANATLHTALDLDPDPRAVARLLNRALLRSGGRRDFLTLFYALLDPPTGRLDYLCAGHPFPLLRRRDGTVIEMGEGGFPLGLRADLAPAAATAVLEPGDLLVLYTDGLPEALGLDGEAFGFERLRTQAAEEADPTALHDRILADFKRHVGGQDLKDDWTLLVVGRRG